MFSKTTIPVFFSEYGCNLPEGVPREFNEVQALYGKQMTVLSGGLVYEYSQETSDYGLVVINDNSTISLRQDYNNLQGQFNKLDIGLLESANATATSLKPPTCSSGLISDSGFSKDFTIPPQPSGAADLIKNGIKNPNNGKLVQVTATAAPVAVYGANGLEIKNLGLRILSNDDSNTPNGESTSSTSTGSAASPSATKKGSAGRLSLGTTTPIFLILSFAAVLLML